jgi:hypothetical protein
MDALIKARSPPFSFNASRKSMSRAAAAPLLPRASATYVQAHPKPLDAPVMNQTL